MKKSVLFSFVLITFLFASLSGVIAVSNVSESTMVNDAYSCLNDRIDEKKCENMAMSELIFSTMATGECEDELRDAAKTSGDELECWPKGGCDIKTTAQAMIALDIEQRDSEKIIEWFNERRIVPKDVEWFLQIDTINASTCTISYSGNSYETEILENKKFTRNAGTCLIPSQSEYWLKIQPSCLEKEFEISCEERFVTSLLFKERTSSTIHVSRESSSEPEGGTSIEKISSFCFKEGVACNYEGTLWSVTALEKIDYDILSFIPYLVTAKETNRGIFSQPLLYILTGYDEYKLDILDRQVADKYWQSRDGKYFDTALALFPFGGVDFEEKTNAIEWLSELQDEDGCWDEGNIKNMGFLLSSIWPRYWDYDDDDDDDPTTPTTPDNDCELSGYYCDSAFARTGEDSLSDYSCLGSAQRCYETAPIIETCASEYPESYICAYNEVCPSGRKNLDGEVCCEVECQQKETPPAEEESDCALAQGYCASSCASGEVEESFYEDSCSEIYYGDVCCITEEEKSSYLWLWILFALIILITIAIIYRDKIREQILKMKSKKDEEELGPREGLRRPMQRMRQRRIIPNVRPSQRPLQPQRPGISPALQRPAQPRPAQPGMQRNPRQKTPEELDDVLRKLKDMSK